MRDLRLTAIRLPFNRNRVNPPMLQLILLSIMLRRIEHVLLLSGRNCLLRIPEASRSPRFDFDEDHDLATFKDEINFPIRRADIPIHKHVALFLQIFCGNLLTPASDFLVVIHDRIVPQCKTRKVSYKKFFLRIVFSAIDFFL